MKEGGCSWAQIDPGGGDRQKPFSSSGLRSDEERHHESRTLTAAGFYSETPLPVKPLIVGDDGSVCGDADAGRRHGDGGVEHGPSDER